MENAAREKDVAFMHMALEEARAAFKHGDVPVGAVMVYHDPESGLERVIAATHNTREADGNALGHAEISAIDAACRARGGWRLSDCTLYVTLEPCPMCAGAIINARIPRVYYGARDREMGACGGVLNLFMERFPHHPALVGGILAEECRQVLTDFFKGLRK